MRWSREGGTGGPENHKAIGFLSNTGPYHKAAKLTFNVRLPSVCQRNAI